MDNLKLAKELIDGLGYLSIGYTSDADFRNEATNALEAARVKLLSVTDEVSLLKAQNDLLLSTLLLCVELCTLRGVYVGDFYRDAVRRVKSTAQQALDEVSEREGAES